ncbi:MAG: hypothetical protein QG637_1554 [Chloroflexota bacterium]|nr:hypothetical protein [Chloroflexota bacterium]
MRDQRPLEAKLARLAAHALHKTSVPDGGNDPLSGTLAYQGHPFHMTFDV